MGGDAFQQSFGGTPLTQDDVRGLRTWTTRWDGALIGQFNRKWLSGEMVSECLMGSRHRGGSKHISFHPDCTCGFYAYWEDSFDNCCFGMAVIGIISGYGQAVIGTRGFRAQRARILALCYPKTGSWYCDCPDCEQTKRDINFLPKHPDYRELPWFRDFDQMVAEFPPTKAGELTP